MRRIGVALIATSASREGGGDAAEQRHAADLLWRRLMLRARPILSSPSSPHRDQQQLLLPPPGNNPGEVLLWRRSRILSLIALSLLIAACTEPQEPTRLSGGHAPLLVGAPAVAHPLVANPIPQHPALAANGNSYMHGDGYSSDTHPGPGPLGHDLQMNSRSGSRMPGGACPIVTVDKKGHMIVLCADLFRFSLQLLEPRSLKLLARYPLPSRPSSFHALVTLDPDKIMSDSSGAYFYLDEQDRIVYADAEQNIQRIGYREVAPGQWEFQSLDKWSLEEVAPHDCFGPTNWFPKGECDPITGVMPDYEGRIWWITRRGRLGTLNTGNGAIKAMHLKGEEIQNGFSVARDGIYIVSDFAMYRFYPDTDGTPEVGWRELYDRGSGRKVGSINQGSGTTPTLLGDRYVTITDNADERINLLVYRREQDYAGKRLVCSVPLFERNGSATDNSSIAWGRSIITENNAGYRNALTQKEWDAPVGGITRVDVREDESGCDVVWHSRERSPSVVPKLSLGNGLAYFYTFERQAEDKITWHLTALDFATGKTAFKILVGTGKSFDNNWSPITLAPDGTAYIGTFKGIVAVWDGKAGAGGR